MVLIVVASVLRSAEPRKRPIFLFVWCCGGGVVFGGEVMSGNCVVLVVLLIMTRLCNDFFSTL